MIDDPADRETVRRAGAVLHLALLEATQQCGTTKEDPSVTRAELRAVAVDLRYTRGYCAMIGESPEHSSLEAPDVALCHFARRMGKKLRAIVEAIEERLS